MFKVHQLAKMVPATLTCATLQAMPVITESASLDSTGKLNISLGNIDIANSQVLTITLNGVAANKYKSVSGQIINGPTDSSYNDYNKAENVNIQTFSSTNFTFTGSTLTVTLPAHSVVMLRLDTVSTSVGSWNRYNPAEYSIRSQAGSKLVIDYAVTSVSPVHLTLYGLDGRVVAQHTVTPAGIGQQRITWQPKAGIAGNNLYVLKMVAGGVTKTQSVVLTR
jgi:hypothetical protein